MKTQLKDRTLWFDGTIQVAPEMVPELFLSGVSPKEVAVDSLNDDIKQFNALSDEPLEFGKIKNRLFDMSWKIPQKYRELDIEALLLSKVPDDERYKARLKSEINEISVRGMIPLMRTLVYVLDRFRETNTVWGVGRGSSCASLALFLIGLHKVDPIKYNIAMEEFFHD